MKGKTICPKCNHEFIFETPKHINKYKTICPKCSCNFSIIKTKEGIKSEEECTWEEYGEPRKTILSSIKPRTDKPMIAAIILVFVFILGISSAIFSVTFIETPLNILSDLGVTGNVEFIINDQSNNSLKNITIIVNNIAGKTNIEGRYFLNNIKLGITDAKIIIPPNLTIKKDILITPYINSYNRIIIDDNIKKYYPYDTVGCSIIILIFSIIALLGAVACFKRQNFDIAIVGSILGIFSFGFLMIGSILCIIAIIIILRSKDEFEDGKKGKNF